MRLFERIVENEQLKPYVESYQRIQESDVLNEEEKAIAYAELMTRLENAFNISMFDSLNTHIAKDVLAFYKLVSMSRVL